MIACGNEDTLESQIHFDDLYGIQDDPNDPVKHEIYNIYKEYGVPVYFNDTIGRIFLKTDVNGQPVYQIETLDLAWRYDYYEKSNYKYLYIKDADRQLEIISWIRNYLEAADEVSADADVIERLEACFERCGHPYVKGKTWTTDAIYRETAEVIAERKETGCLCVEMECAAAMAVAKFRDIPFAQFLYGADNLDSDSWESRDLTEYGLSGAEKYMALAFEGVLAL